MERKIGERFKYEGKVYVVAEDNNRTPCAGCAFFFIF